VVPARPGGVTAISTSIAVRTKCRRCTSSDTEYSRCGNGGSNSNGGEPTTSHFQRRGSAGSYVGSGRQFVYEDV
jgi:hypothetical protein